MATQDPRVIVIGAGFGGLGAARALREHGISDITILERADSVGGVWRDNTYPDAACDVPSPLYSWSWALNPSWGRRYSKQPEILAYLRSAAEREGLLDLVVTGAEVASCTWSEDDATWTVTTAGGASYVAEVVVTATGQLSNPVIPSIPGAETFAGPAFHSAEWRHDVDLAGKRVAVIGTGASAIQFVPGIVDRVSSLAVFQRSAPYVVSKPDIEYSPLHRRVYDRSPRLMARLRSNTFWMTEKLNAALGKQVSWSPLLLGAIRAAWRLQLRTQVSDPELRRKLVPDYEIGCKRILFSNDWYPALDRRHVAVITDAVTAIEPGGVRAADGTLHEADVLIWGTGFAATSFLRGVTITGRDGRDLHREWADGARAHLGITVPGFPNLFSIYGPNTNLGGSSIIAMMEAQADWVAQVVARLRGGSLSAVEVRPEVYDAYDSEMQARLRESAWVGCDSWYVDGSRVTTNWPGKVGEYQERTASVDWSQLALT